MKTKDALNLVKEMFSSELVVRRIEVDIFPDEEEGEQVIDLTFIVDGDLYDAETQLIPRITELMMREPDLLLDFMILPSRIKPEPEGTVLYRREP